MQSATASLSTSGLPAGELLSRSVAAVAAECRLAGVVGAIVLLDAVAELRNRLDGGAPVAVGGRLAAVVAGLAIIGAAVTIQGQIPPCKGGCCHV